MFRLLEVFKNISVFSFGDLPSRSIVLSRKKNIVVCFSDACSIIFSILWWYSLLWFVKNSPAIQENRVTTVQCLSGTGSLRVGGEFLARNYHQVNASSHFSSSFIYSFIFLYGGLLFESTWTRSILQRMIYIPQPTWGNHAKLFPLAGLSVKTYRYYDPPTRGLNFQGQEYYPSLYGNLYRISFAYCTSVFDLVYVWFIGLWRKRDFFLFFFLGRIHIQVPPCSSIDKCFSVRDFYFYF